MAFEKRRDFQLFLLRRTGRCTAMCVELSRCAFRLRTRCGRTRGSSLDGAAGGSIVELGLHAFGLLVRFGFPAQAQPNIGGQAAELPSLIACATAASN